MARKKVMLQIDGDILKSIIKDKTTISELSNLLGRSRQLFYDTFKNNEISPRFVSAITKELQLSPDDLDRFLKKKTSVNMTITITIWEDKNKHWQ